MAINLNLLRTFKMVADCGSFSRAARESHVSQPAVTQAVQELEKQVGMPLLERGTRGVRLTEGGYALLGHARIIFAAESAAEDELKARRGLSSGSLSIGASLTIANYYLPPYVAQFQQRYPGLSLRLASQNTESIERRLLDFELDVALVEGPVHNDRLQLRLWKNDQLGVIAPPGHSLAGQKEVSAADLSEELWVVREPGSGTREVVEVVLGQRHLQWSNTLQVNSTAAIKQIVASGLGLAVVSLHAAADQIALGKLCVLNVPELTVTRPLNFVSLKGRPAGVAARTFQEFLFQREAGARGEAKKSFANRA